MFFDCPFPPCRTSRRAVGDNWFRRSMCLSSDGERLRTKAAGWERGREGDRGREKMVPGDRAINVAVTNGPSLE